MRNGKTGFSPCQQRSPSLFRQKELIQMERTLIQGIWLAPWRAWHILASAATDAKGLADRRMNHIPHVMTPFWASKGTMSNQLTLCDAAQRGGEWIIKIPSTHARTDKGCFTKLQLDCSAGLMLVFTSIRPPLDTNTIHSFGILQAVDIELRTCWVRAPDFMFRKMTAQQHQQHFSNCPSSRDEKPHALWWNTKTPSIVCHSLSPHLHNKS